jgi:hypothetical protein
MRSGGQTTVIRRILEKRAQKPPEIQEDTSATIAVMLRVLPPPRALLVFEDAGLRDTFENAIAESVLDSKAVDNELEALRLFGAGVLPGRRHRQPGVDSQAARAPDRSRPLRSVCGGAR